MALWHRTRSGLRVSYLPQSLLMAHTTPEDNGAPVLDRVAALLREAQDICKAEPAASFENVWHTLLLLEMEPIERLNTGLMRGRLSTVQP
jgi:hypothetical protein